KEWVLDQMQLVSQRVLVETMRARARWNADAAITECSVPMYYIASANTPADLRRLTSLSPETVLGMTPEVGHFLQLLAPSRVNALIESHLKTLESSDKASLITNPSLAPGEASSSIPLAPTTPLVPPPDLPSVPPPPAMPPPSSLPPVV
ncbi:MAG: alpha/beta fold hydrolase, partial [Pseudonocardiaceae bacterium]